MADDRLRGMKRDGGYRKASTASDDQLTDYDELPDKGQGKEKKDPGKPRASFQEIGEKYDANSYDGGIESSLAVHSRKDPSDMDGMIPNMRGPKTTTPGTAPTYKGKTPKGPPAWED